MSETCGALVFHSRFLFLGFLVAARARRQGRASHGKVDGVDAWRMLPLEIPSNMDVILRNRFNDVVLEEFG